MYYTYNKRIKLHKAFLNRGDTTAVAVFGKIGDLFINNVLESAPLWSWEMYAILYNDPERTYQTCKTVKEVHDIIESQHYRKIKRRG